MSQCLHQQTLRCKQGQWRLAGGAVDANPGCVGHPGTCLLVKSKQVCGTRAAPGSYIFDVLGHGLDRCPSSAGCWWAGVDMAFGIQHRLVAWGLEQALVGGAFGVVAVGDALGHGARATRGRRWQPMGQVAALIPDEPSYWRWLREAQGHHKRYRFCASSSSGCMSMGPAPKSTWTYPEQKSRRYDVSQVAIKP